MRRCCGWHGLYYVALGFATICLMRNHSCKRGYGFTLYCCYVGHMVFSKLYNELRRYPVKFVAFCRLSIPGFDNLVHVLRPYLFRQETCMQLSVSPEEHLLVTLRFLATGHSYSSLHFEFLLGTSTISGIVRSTCDVIWDKLKSRLMPQPNTQDWLRIAQGFMEATEFPNCIGALDGKQIRVKKPPNSGSHYFYYKKYFSVVLLAVADSSYSFVVADIGAYGSASDVRIFRPSRLARQLADTNLNLPQPCVLPGASGPPAPFIMVADEGFALSRNVLRPFSRRGLDNRRRIFNTQLMKALRLVECAFGIFTSRWRIFETQIQMHPQNVQAVIKATVLLHNFCQQQEPSLDDDDGRCGISKG
ncbi:uncharacterized protein [Ranitomeya imitator]|uniref:uncharacterized protein n=1 Tax=Ranitomeya imitator TaxID=111125 RepID=UPI0037E84AAE